MSIIIIIGKKKKKRKDNNKKKKIREKNILQNKYFCINGILIYICN